jgi:hypothetical protein
MLEYWNNGILGFKIGIGAILYWSRELFSLDGPISTKPIIPPFHHSIIPFEG